MASPQSITYTLKYSSGTKTIVIGPGNYDGPLHLLEVPPDTSKVHSSLNLPGHKTLKYGEMINNNLLWLLEHFAKDTPPVAPTPGQIWFDTKTNGLKVMSKSMIWNSVPSINNPLPREGDIRIIGNTILMFANGTYCQLYPPLLSGVIAMNDDWGLLNELETSSDDWGLISSPPVDFEDFGSIAENTY